MADNSSNWKPIGKLAVEAVSRATDARDLARLKEKLQIAMCLGQWEVAESYHAKIVEKEGDIEAGRRT